MFAGLGDLLPEEVGDSNAKKVKKYKSKEKRPKVRPAGVSVEAYKLMNCGIISASNSEEIVIEANPSASFKTAKAQIGFTRPHKYRWTPFMNQGRSDNLQLFHWEREDRKEQIYRFAQWNKSLHIEKYSAQEYESFYKTVKWSKAETDHLFELCERFDLRWPIIHDRYDQSLAISPRSVEDLKERFYEITNDIKIRKKMCFDLDPDAVAYNFDAEHERRRKEQEEILWNRTPEEIAEEKTLKDALKQFEARKKIREQSARKLQSYMDSLKEPELRFVTPSSVGPSVSSRTVRKSASRKSLVKAVVKPLVPKLSKEAAMKAFKVPNFKPGPHLRSGEHYELKKTTKGPDISKIFAHYGFKELNDFHASEELISMYNDIRLGIVCLGDLKKALTIAEAEINRLSEDYPDVADLKQAMFKTPTEKLSPDEFGGPGQAATSRELTALLQLPPPS